MNLHSPYFYSYLHSNVINNLPIPVNVIRLFVFTSLLLQRNTDIPVCTDAVQTGMSMLRKTKYIMEFKDKIVLITGAASGIGRQTALEFAKQGGMVVVSDVNEKGGAETVQLIESEGGKATFIKNNVADSSEVEQLIHTIVERYGSLDIAINNAGVGGGAARLADVSIEEWHDVMSINASGVFYCMKYELQQMMKQGSGNIVNIASVAGLRALPNSSPYVASKHAVVGLTKTAAKEYARKNIRINALCPVFTVTALFDPKKIEQGVPGLPDKLKAAIPMKRFAEVQEMTDAIIWLCSEKSSFVTGLALQVDGGMMA